MLGAVNPSLSGASMSVATTASVGDLGPPRAPAIGAIALANNGAFIKPLDYEIVTRPCN